jgi:hypothetical protein
MQLLKSPKNDPILMTLFKIDVFESSPIPCMHYPLEIEKQILTGQGGGADAKPSTERRRKEKQTKR